MTKELKIDLLNKTSAVISTLNTLEIKGKQNLLNLAGCIGVVEEVQQTIAMQPEDSDITSEDVKDE